MRVLIITQWFPPEPAGLMLEFAHSLVGLGHEVEVLTGFPNYPSGVLYRGYRQRLWQREEVGGVRVVRVPLYPEHSRSSIKRVANYLSFAASAALLGPFLTKRPDAVFVYGSPYTAAIPAVVLRAVKRVPFVLNVQDLWPDSLSSTGMLGPRPLRLIHHFADWLYRRAAAIVTLSAGFARRIADRQVPAEKIHVISNWADVNHYRPVGIDDAYRAEMGLDGRFVVMYAGAIGPPQGLDAVIDAAKLLGDDDRIRIVLVGDGLDLTSLKARADTLGLTNVSFLGRKPEAEMPRIYALADALLVHLKSDPQLDITIPHKVFAYMATAKPVIAAVGADASAVIRDTKSGITCAPGNASSIAAAVRELANLPRETLAEYGANGRRAVCHLYSRDRLVPDFAAVLETVAAAHSHR